MVSCMDWPRDEPVRKYINLRCVSLVAVHGDHLPIVGEEIFGKNEKELTCPLDVNV